MNKLQKFLLMICLLCLQSNVKAEEESSLNAKEKGDFSRYLGYLFWRDYLHKFSISYDLDQVIIGIKEAESGKFDLKNNDPDILSAVKKFQAEKTKKDGQTYQQEAEKYLKTIAHEPNIVEVRKDQLYYKIMQQGIGPEISAEPVLHLKAQSLNDGKINLFYSSYSDSPVKLYLEETLDGFQLGVKGMKKGEIRKIYSHPNLAYGLGRVGIPPNSLIIFEVEAVEGY